MDEAWLEGIISIDASMRSQSREIHAIYTHPGKLNRDIERLLSAANSAGIKVEKVSRQFIEVHTSGKSHGGIIASVGPRKFFELGELIDGESKPIVAMLDGIEDPFNFGQAVRALYAAGISGLVVRSRNWLSAVGIVSRASAGATELMPMARVKSVAVAAEYYREKGLIVACTARKGSVSIFESDLTQSLFLLIGGEKRGMTRSFIKQSDLKLSIPYGRSFSRSLGTVASAAVLAFEIMRQRTQNP